MKLTVTNSVMGIGSIASVVLFNYAESWAVFYAAWTILFSFGLVVTLALDFDAWIHSRKESQECNTLRAALEMSEKLRATILEQYHAEIENNGALQSEKEELLGEVIMLRSELKSCQLNQPQPRRSEMKFALHLPKSELSEKLEKSLQDALRASLERQAEDCIKGKANA